MKISAVINTYNGRQHLAEVIGRLRGLDEVLVCDMESTDGTPELARSLGARVVTFPKGEYSYVEPARNFAIRSAANEWVLLVDDDELISPELIEYFKEFVKNPGDVKGIHIPRKNYFFDKWNKVTYPDYQIRFFARDLIDWPPYVHALPSVEGKTEYIPKEREELAMIHIPHDLRGMMDRCNRYTTAEVAKRGVKRVSLAAMFFKPAVRFFKSYVLKGGWRNGKAGFIDAANNAYYKYMTLAKMYEAAAMKDFYEKG